MPNICVKLPGVEGAGAATGAGEGAGTGGVGLAKKGSGIAAGTGAGGGAGAAGGWLESVPNICVKLPGVAADDGGGGGAALENVAPIGGAELAAGAGAGLTGKGANGSGFASALLCPSSDASRSSSLRAGGEDKVPNIPVALDELPPPDPLEESGLSNGDPDCGPEPDPGASIATHLQGK